MRWIRAAAVLALLGGTLGVALDAMHVASGTTFYTHPSVFGVAWWTFPLFASAAAAIGLSPPAIEHILSRTPKPPATLVSLAGMSLFVLAYLTSCVIHGALGAFVLLCIAGVLWFLVDRRPLGIAHAIATAIGGFIVEAALVHAGLFVHTDGAILGIPLWLPCLYLSASLGVSSLARVLLARR